MSDLESANLGESNNECQLENDLADKVELEKPYLNVTSYLIIFCLLVCAGFGALGLVAYQQQKHTDLIELQHASLEKKVLQTSYLRRAGNLIELLSTNQNISDYIAAQKELRGINKKLASIDSKHQRIYRKWQLKDTSQKNLAKRISLHHKRNQKIKIEFVQQLSNLLTTIEKQQRFATNKAELIYLKKQFQHLSVLVESLDLHTPLRFFERLREDAENVLSSKLFLTAHKNQNNNDSVSIFEQQLLMLEDLALSQGLLAKWQGHLRLSSKYYQQLFEVQEQVTELLQKLTTETIDKTNRVQPLNQKNITTLSHQQLPLIFIISFIILCIFFASLFWFICQRIKNYSFKYDELFMQMKNSPQHLQQAKYSDKEFECLEKKFKQQQEKLAIAHDNEKQQTSSFDLFKSTTNTQVQMQLGIQKNYNQALVDINLSQLNSLVLLSLEGTSLEKKSLEEVSADEYVYQLYVYSRALFVRLNQEKLHSYLQTDKATLCLNDVNLVTEVQAICLNQLCGISHQNNQINLIIDKTIQAAVKLDVDIFSELIRVFTQLLLAEKSGVDLAITLALEDKNDGQQNLSFTGVVQIICKEENASQAEIKPSLPTLLQYIHEGNKQAQENELLSYFYTLLTHQHGDLVSVMLTEQGYQLSFIMPLAVMKKCEPIADSDLLVKPNTSINKPELVNLRQSYQAQAIEVLLAVKMPKARQELLQLLQSFGLQVTLVTHAVTQQKQWKSGRFALLITEFEQSPFVDFTDNLADGSRFQRGIFSLGHTFILPNDNKFSGWHVAKLAESLNLTAYIKQLVTVLSPWLKIKASNAAVSIQNKHNVEVSQANISPLLEQKSSLNTQVKPAFDFELYFLNQGSAELALYMLDDYITENLTLVAKLTQALVLEDFKIVSDVISSLLLNGKILAATELIQCCHHWQTLLSIKHYSSEKKKEENNALQAKLLSKTKQEVAAIASYAQVV